MPPVVHSDRALSVRAADGDAAGKRLLHGAVPLGESHQCGELGVIFVIALEMEGAIPPLQSKLAAHGVDRTSSLPTAAHSQAHRHHLQPFAWPRYSKGPVLRGLSRPACRADDPATRPAPSMRACRCG